MRNIPIKKQVILQIGRSPLTTLPMKMLLNFDWEDIIFQIIILLEITLKELFTARELDMNKQA